MKIAVLLAGIGYDSQQRLIRGLIDRTVGGEDEVFIFTCAGWDYNAKSLSEIGEFMIYELPDFTQYDGVLMNGDTIHNIESTAKIRERINEAAIPCVSIDVDYPEHMLIQIDNKKGFSHLIDHLVKEHDVKDVFFVCGDEQNTDGTERLDSCKETLEKYGYKLPKDKIYYGDYTYDSGRKAVELILGSGKPLPDAIVCANDHMAVGAILALKENGYSVPQDIIVTGYDNSIVAEYASPRITSIDRGEYEAGKLAYEMLKAASEKKPVVRRREIQGVPVIGESCGCVMPEENRLAKLAIQNMSAVAQNSKEQEILRNSATEFSATENFEEFLVVLDHYVREMDPEYFYFCLCGNYDDYNEKLEQHAAGIGGGFNFSTYTETVDIPLAYEKGSHASYFGIPTKELIPRREEKDKDKAFYLIYPLHFQTHCIGYCVFRNTKHMIGSLFVENMVINIDNALEFIKRQDTMSAMLRRLNKMWILDEMTGAYNRAGFKEYAEQLMRFAVENHKPVGVIFADADGLKKVNDAYGHEEGDHLILAIARIMQQALDPAEQLCRYGGDEFVILTVGKPLIDIKRQIEKIKVLFDRFNRMSDAPFVLDASIGYAFEEDAAEITLDELIGKADQAMYDDKNKKKAEKLAEEG